MFVCTCAKGLSPFPGKQHIGAEYQVLVEQVGYAPTQLVGPDACFIVSEIVLQRGEGLGSGNMGQDTHDLPFHPLPV